MNFFGPLWVLIQELEQVDVLFHQFLIWAQVARALSALAQEMQVFKQLVLGFFVGFGERVAFVDHVLRKEQLVVVVNHRAIASVFGVYSM